MHETVCGAQQRAACGRPMSDVDAQTLRASYCTMPYGLQEGTVAARGAWEYLDVVMQR